MTESIVNRDTTQALVLKAQTGDRAAFEALVARYEGRLREIVSMRLGAHLRGKLEIEDVLQETFVRALQSISRFTWRDEPAFLRWLQVIAENRIRDALKGTHRAVELQLQNDVQEGGVSPSKHVRRNERFDRLQQSLDRLSPDHRRVIFLSRIEGLRTGEIARRMNRSESAVKSLLFRALRELKSSFGDTGSLHLPDRSLENYGSDRNGQ